VCCCEPRRLRIFTYQKHFFSLWLALINLDGNYTVQRLGAFYVPLLLKRTLLVAGNGDNGQRRTGSDVRRRPVCIQHCWSAADADYWSRVQLVLVTTNRHRSAGDVNMATVAGNWIKCTAAVLKSNRFVTDNILRLWFSAAIGLQFTVRVPL